MKKRGNYNNLNPLKSMSAINLKAVQLSNRNSDKISNISQIYDTSRSNILNYQIQEPLRNLRQSAEYGVRNKAISHREYRGLQEISNIETEPVSANLNIVNRARESKEIKARVNENIDLKNGRVGKEIVLNCQNNDNLVDVGCTYEPKQIDFTGLGETLDIGSNSMIINMYESGIENGIHYKFISTYLISFSCIYKSQRYEKRLHDKL